MRTRRAKRTDGRAQPAGAARVLVVATAEAAQLAGRALEPGGWRVRTVEGARAAAEQLATEPADIVLIAERPTPRATLALLRQLGRAAPASRRIVLAAGGAADDRLAYVNQGGAQFVLRPPLSGHAVRRAVERVWQELAAERAAQLKGTAAGDVLAKLQSRMEAQAEELARANGTLRRTLREIRARNRALATLNESLRIQSTTDPLTGLFNRREFLNRIRTEWGRFKRYGRPLSLVLLDIDRFKQVNDTYGHECGDVVLRELGQLVREHKRAQDLCCRYGGEEFVVLLTETTLDAAFHVAEGLRRLVGGHPFRYEGQRLQMHISLGVSGAGEQKPADVEAFINLADKAMYRAKHEGRNRTVVLDAADESRIARQSRGVPSPRRAARSSRGTRDSAGR